MAAHDIDLMVLDSMKTASKMDDWVSLPPLQLCTQNTHSELSYKTHTHTPHTHTSGGSRISQRRVLLK